MRVGLQHHALVGRPLLELVGAGAQRVAVGKVSSLVLMSLGSTDLFFSAQALLMMRSSVSWFTSTGLGNSEWMSMV